MGQGAASVRVKTQAIAILLLRLCCSGALTPSEPQDTKHATETSGHLRRLLVGVFCPGEELRGVPAAQAQGGNNSCDAATENASKCGGEAVAACHASCLDYSACSAWTFKNGGCFLKQECPEGGVPDLHAISGITHEDVTHARTVLSNDLHVDGLLKRVNCWGVDIAKVSVHLSTGEALVHHGQHEPAAVLACRDACLSTLGCGAWTLSRGSARVHETSDCFLMEDCAGRQPDPFAVSGTVNRTGTVGNGWPYAIIDSQKDRGSLNGMSQRNFSMLDGSLAIPNGTNHSGSQAATKTSTNSSLTKNASLHEETRGTANVTGNRSGVLNNTIGGAPASQPGGNSSDRSMQGERHSSTVALRVLEPAMVEPPQPPATTTTEEPSTSTGSTLSPEAQTSTGTTLSPEAQRVVGGVFGASAGALAVGLLAGLLAPTSTMPLTVTTTWGGMEQAMNVSNETVIFAGDSDKTATDDVLGRWWWLAPMLLVFLLCCVMACLIRGKGPLSPAVHARKRSTARDVDYTPLAHAPPQDDLFGEVASLEDPAQSSMSHNWQDHVGPTGASVNGPEPNWLDFTKVSLPPPEPIAPVHGPVRSQQQNEFPDLFEAIDTNHDGVISGAEFAESSRRAFDFHAALGQGAPSKAAPLGQVAPPKAAPPGPVPPLHSWPGHIAVAWTGPSTGTGALSLGPTASSKGLFPAEPMVAPFGAAGSGSIAGRGPSSGSSRQVSDSTGGFLGFAHGQAPTAPHALDPMRGFPGFAHEQAPAAPPARNAMVAPTRMPSVRPAAAAAAPAPVVEVAVGGYSSVPPCPPPTLAVPSFTPPFAAVSARAANHLIPSEPVAASSTGKLR